MEKIREIVYYGPYFRTFLKSQPEKVQNKIFKVLEAIETIERIPKQYIKHLPGTRGLYEARIQLGNDIRRIFCFFDHNRLVILLNGFQKKNQKTPKKELSRALKLMQQYYENKT
jgi:phage-related protein